MTSDERSAVNRRNAQKSTGPRTDAGKAAARQNSLKHGLTGQGVVLKGDDASAVEARLADYHATAQPANLYEREFLRRMAIASVRLERCERADEARRLQRTKRVAKRAEGMHRRSLFKNVDVFRHNPAEGARLLRATSAGCAWMAEQWRGLGRKLAAKRRWTDQEFVEAINLLGLDPSHGPEGDEESVILRSCYVALNERLTPDEADCALGIDTSSLDLRARVEAIQGLLPARGVARERLVGLVDEQVARLQELGETLQVEVEAPDLALRLAAAEVDSSPEGMRFARYEAMNEQALHRNWNAFARLRKAKRLGLASDEDLADGERAQNEASCTSASEYAEDIYANADARKREPAGGSEEAAGKPAGPNAAAVAPAEALATAQDERPQAEAAA